MRKVNEVLGRRTGVVGDSCPEGVGVMGDVAVAPGAGVGGAPSATWPDVVGCTDEAREIEGVRRTEGAREVARDRDVRREGSLGMSGTRLHPKRETRIAVSDSCREVPGWDCVKMSPPSVWSGSGAFEGSSNECTAETSEFSCVEDWRITELVVMI